MVTITNSAAKKVKELMAEHASENVALRIRVVGGGCSGLQYDLSFEENFDSGDKVADANGVKVCVDSKSALYVKGLEVDYVEGLMGGGFKLRNPNAISTCGCGESFNV